MGLAPQDVHPMGHGIPTAAPSSRPPRLPAGRQVCLFRHFGPMRETAPMGHARRFRLYEPVNRAIAAIHAGCQILAAFPAGGPAYRQAGLRSGCKPLAEHEPVGAICPSCWLVAVLMLAKSSIEVVSEPNVEPLMGLAPQDVHPMGHGIPTAAPSSRPPRLPAGRPADRRAYLPVGRSACSATSARIGMPRHC